MQGGFGEPCIGKPCLTPVDVPAINELYGVLVAWAKFKRLAEFENQYATVGANPREVRRAVYLINALVPS